MRISFFKNTSGNIAILAAFLLLPMIGMIGLAIDYGNTTHTKARLNQAADAAAVAAILAASDILASGSSDFSQARTMAVNQFKANAGPAYSLLIGDPTVTIALNGTNIDASVTYSAQEPSIIGQMFNQTTYSSAGSSSASKSTPLYAQFYIVLDMSTSMGLGADTSDQQTLLATPNINCSFVCHSNSDALNAYAKLKNVTLRVDVLRNALTQFLTAAKQFQATSNQFQFTVYRFDNAPTPLVSTTDPNATNIDYVIGKLSPLTVSNLGNGTDYHQMMRTINPLINKSGDGTSASKRKIFFLLITDGIEDSVYLDPFKGYINDPNFVSFPPFSDLRTFMRVQGFDPSLCSYVKSQNATSLVLHVQYVVPPNTPDYPSFDFIRNTLGPNTAASLQGCASDSRYYYSANSSDEILNATRTILQDTLAKARITF